MRSSVFFWIFAVLGIAFLTTLSVEAASSANGWLILVFTPLDIMLFCYVINKVIKVDTNETDVAAKHPRIFGFLAALGIAFLAAFFLVYYGIEAGLLATLEFLFRYPADYLLWFLFIGGTIFATVGISGVGGRYFKSERWAFAFLTVFIVPSFTFGLWFTIIVSTLPTTY
jgi:hypothetical protein